MPIILLRQINSPKSNKLRSLINPMKPPLSIFVLWHSEFQLGVKYAELIFSEFNRKIEDPLARGINIPVFFRQKPPLDVIPFTDYQFVVIIALVDSSFVLDQTLH